MKKNRQGIDQAAEKFWGGIPFRYRYSTYINTPFWGEGGGTGEVGRDNCFGHYRDRISMLPGGFRWGEDRSDEGEGNVAQF